MKSLDQLKVSAAIGVVEIATATGWVALTAEHERSFPLAVAVAFYALAGAVGLDGGRRASNALDGAFELGQVSTSEAKVPKSLLESETGLDELGPKQII